MKFAVLTASDIRHRYVANALARSLDVSVVGYEQTGYAPEESPLDELSFDEQTVFRSHFRQRQAAEQRYFGHDAETATCDGGRRVFEIPFGQLNSQLTLQVLQRGEADALLVYGTNLIRDEFLRRWPGRIVNLHLGLSPHYRGSATNFYPLLNEEPEFVGATIHLIDAGIDSGPILSHARPEVRAKDGPHDIGCRAILEGVTAMVASVRNWELGVWKAVPQWKPDRQRLYLRKDYHPRQVVDLYRKIESGMMDRYLRRAGEAAPKVTLIQEQGFWSRQPA